VNNLTLTEFPLERAGHVDTKYVAGEVLKPRSIERRGDFFGYQRLVLGHLDLLAQWQSLASRLGKSGVLSGDLQLLGWLLTANRRHFCRVDYRIIQLLVRDTVAVHHLLSPPRVIRHQAIPPVSLRSQCGVPSRHQSRTHRTVIGLGQDRGHR